MSLLNIQPVILVLKWVKHQLSWMTYMGLIIQDDLYFSGGLTKLGCLMLSTNFETHNCHNSYRSLNFFSHDTSHELWMLIWGDIESEQFLMCSSLK